jgi:hypothetical protein
MSQELGNERRAAIRPNVRAALDYLDGIFAKGGEDAQALWDVLSALRGPDVDPSEESFMKRDVTIPVRRAAFPKTCYTVCEAYFGPYDAGVHQRASFGTRGRSYSYQGLALTSHSLNNGHVGHFALHGCRAAEALGLI